MLITYGICHFRLDNGFQDAYNKFQNFRTAIIKNNDTARKTCLTILKWGGVEAHNKEKINNRPNLLEFLSTMKKVIEQDEIFVEDLNPNLINSGYTKIYTAVSEDFIMYDGRVGAALCFLVRCYLDEKDIQ